MVALLVAVPAMRRSSAEAIRSLLVVVIAAVVPIAFLMFYQVRRGRRSNVDASNPSERPILFTFAVAGLVAGLGWLLANDPQSFLVRGMLVSMVFLFVAAFLTRWVKPSLHVAFVALAATSFPCSDLRSATCSLPWSRWSSGRASLSLVIAFASSWSDWCSACSPGSRLWSFNHAEAVDSGRFQFDLRRPHNFALGHKERRPQTCAQFLGYRMTAASIPVVFAYE